jgi:hypothetical protein
MICPMCNKLLVQTKLENLMCPTTINSGPLSEHPHFYQYKSHHNSASSYLARTESIELYCTEVETAVYIVNGYYYIYPILTLEPITIEQIPAIFKRVKNLMAFS